MYTIFTHQYKGAVCVLFMGHSAPLLLERGIRFGEGNLEQQQVVSFKGCGVAVLVVTDSLCDYVVVEETKGVGWGGESNGHIVPKYNFLKRKVAMET
jgi:hypothetical protein